MSTITDNLGALLGKLAHLKDASTVTAEIKRKCRALTDAGIKVGESWSGSFAGYHSELYFGNFEKPPLALQFDPEWGGIHGIPDGWRVRSPEDVKSRIEQLAANRFDEITSELENLVDSAKAFQRELSVELAELHGAPDCEREKQLLQEIEQAKWLSKMNEYIHSNTPKTFVSRDSRAMSQGIRVPAHLYYEAEGFDLAFQAKTVEDFVHKAEQLLKPLTRRSQSTSPGMESDTVGLVRRICLRFHNVARQLKHRHAGRPTLEIIDEYDVQDLLHSVLRLHFDDIRPEEWTPSYAGGAARMDFLLKREQIVVETKMPRAGLGEREIGGQLIVDIARYQKHADCKMLVCFVYDPEGRLKNPRGFESDLTATPETGLQVFVVVAP